MIRIDIKKVISMSVTSVKVREKLGTVAQLTKVKK